MTELAGESSWLDSCGSTPSPPKLYDLIFKGLAGSFNLGFLSSKNIMKMSNSKAKTDAVDYYSIVSGIQPGRAPSIFHREYKYYWCEFPQAPVYSIYNTRFYKVTPLAHSVDCSTFGQIHYWARVGSVFCPALVVFHFTGAHAMKKIRYYFFSGMWVDDKESKSMIEIANPDQELFQYALSGFISGYLSKHYSFNQ